MKRLEVAIAGAGPAGLASALALHRQGHAVTVFDQFDRPQPVGSGLILQPTGLAVLDWLGLGDAMRSLGAPIDRLFGRACGSGRIVLDVRYAALGNLRAFAVHRAGLFQVLHDAVDMAGIIVKPSSQIKGLERSSVILNQAGKVGPFDLVVDALGSRSPLLAHASGPDVRVKLPYGAIWASLPWAAQAGFDERALEQRYDKASVMVGVLPIGCRHAGDVRQTAFFWSLKSADFDDWRKTGLDIWKDRVLEAWPQTEPLLESIQSIDQMTLASYEHHTLVHPFGDRLVFVGDSAHSTSPQLGQGANMALLDVMALIQSLEQHAELGPALQSYADKRRLHVRLYQAMSRLFTPFYQSDSELLPLARDYLVASISRMPFIQKFLAHLVSGKLGL